MLAAGETGQRQRRRGDSAGKRHVGESMVDGDRTGLMEAKFSGSAQNEERGSKLFAVLGLRKGAISV